jgi:sporulation protein YlmC with PRC-barrel domain
MGSINPQGSTRGGADIVGGGIGEGPGPDIMAAATLDGNKVMSADGEHVGKISDIMLDVRGGRIAYAVLSEGGFLGMGSKPSPYTQLDAFGNDGGVTKLSEGGC